MPVRECLPRPGLPHAQARSRRPPGLPAAARADLATGLLRPGGGDFIFRPSLGFLAGIFFTLSPGWRSVVGVVVGYGGWMRGREGVSIPTYEREATVDNPARDQSIRRCHDDDAQACQPFRTLIIIIQFYYCSLYHMIYIPTP